MSLASSLFAHPHQAFTAGFYRNESFDFELRVVLGQATFGAADTGGQVVYVLELAKKLAQLGYSVDIWTRRFEDQPAMKTASTPIDETAMT